MKAWTIVTAIGLACCAGLAHAQAAGTLKIVIAFPPGGPVDFVARIVSEGLGKELGQPVIVDNRPGANGAISAQVVAKSPPDGNTLWLTSAGAAVMNPSLYENLTYDMQRDFVPVSLVVNNEEVLVVNPANKANSVSDLVATATAKSDPVPIASSGIGSMPHLAMELLADSTRANLLHVPYKGAAPAITDVMGNQVAGFFGDIPGIIGFIKGGKLKPLGIAAPKRNAVLPDVPTLDEQGIHGVQSNNWYALFAPARTPPARVAQLNTALRRVLTSEPYHARLADSGAEPAPSSPEELARLVQADSAKWGKIIRDKKIKGE
jgi:tripartite-type tricarboxylate transporter receptor subunit TctC